jgi:hypothetical protein
MIPVVRRAPCQPATFYRVARIAIIVVAISLIISVLLSLVDGGPPH